MFRWRVRNDSRWGENKRLQPFWTAARIWFSGGVPVDC